MKLTHIRAKRGGIAVGSIHVHSCPHCGAPPPWLAEVWNVFRLLVLAAILFVLGPQLAAVPAGAFPSNWPHKLGAVGMLVAVACVLRAFYWRAGRNSLTPDRSVGR